LTFGELDELSFGSHDIRRMGRLIGLFLVGGNLLENGWTAGGGDEPEEWWRWIQRAGAELWMCLQTYEVWMVCEYDLDQ
jgi:hypothetical protein